MINHIHTEVTLRSKEKNTEVIVAALTAEPCCEYFENRKQFSELLYEYTRAKIDINKRIRRNNRDWFIGIQSIYDDIGSLRNKISKLEPCRLCEQIFNPFNRKKYHE